MPELRCETSMPATAEELYAWHERPGAFERLIPPWKNVRLLHDPGRIADGLEPVLAVREGPLTMRWVARYEGVQPGKEFTDVQVKGPFSAWRHRHAMLPDPGDRTRSLLRDEVAWRAPLGGLGQALAGGFLQRDLDALFAWRHLATREDLEDIRSAGGRRSGRVLVTGARGLVGAALVPALRTMGYEVLCAVRGRAPGQGQVAWDPERGFAEPKKLEGLVGVVHLAGENIAGGRWTDARKEKIASSRIGPTRRLAETLAALDEPPQAAVFASAIGFYGTSRGEPCTEASSGGAGWLPELSRAWEEASGPLEDRTRVVRVRIGIVLSPKGGALKKMLPAFQAGVAGRLGSGRQPMSWISIEDLVRVLRQALSDPRWRGPINAVAPQPTDNSGFTKTLARVLRRPAVLPVPAAALRAIFGREFADQMLLSGVAVQPAALQHLEFRYCAPDLDTALRRVLGKAPFPSI